MRTQTIGRGSIVQYGYGVYFKVSEFHSVELRDWRLVTDEDAITIESSGHFDELRDQMKVGEAIFATLDIRRTPQFKRYVVAEIDQVTGKVRIAPAAETPSKPGEV